MFGFNRVSVIPSGVSNFGLEPDALVALMNATLANESIADPRLKAEKVSRFLQQAGTYEGEPITVDSKIWKAFLAQRSGGAEALKRAYSRPSR